MQQPTGGIARRDLFAAIIIGISLVLIFVVGSALAASSPCNRKTRIAGVSCTTPHCVCAVTATEPACLGLAYSYSRGTNGDASENCEVIGTAYRQVRLPGDCGPGESYNVGCIWADGFGCL